MTSTRSCPWQYEWKRPQWETPQGHDDKKHNSNQYNEKQLGTPVCSTSAHISLEELEVCGNDTGIGTTIGSRTGNPLTSRNASTPNSSQPELTPLKEGSLSDTAEYLLPLEEDPQPAEAIDPSNSTNGDNGDIVFTVTLFASQKEDTVGDVILLEVMRTSSGEQQASSMKRVRSRILRWPGSALKQHPSGNTDRTTSNSKVEQKTTNEGSTESKSSVSWQNTILPWLHNKQQTRKRAEITQQKHIGLVSVSLCRKPPPKENEEETLVNALDVLNMMSLGLMPQSGEPTSLAATPTPLSSFTADHTNTPSYPANNTAEDSLMHEQDDTASPMPNFTAQSANPLLMDLVLCCLTTDGRMHFYESPLKTLFSPCIHSDSVEDKMGLELASLLLGPTIHRQIQQSLLPLSQPHTTMDLSVPLLKHNANSGSRSKTQQRRLFNANSESSSNDTTRAHIEQDADKEQTTEERKDDIDMVFYNISVQEDKQRNGIWDKSVWDATVEPSTALFRTQDNVPTMSVAAFEFMVVAGKGVRTRRKRVLKTQNNMLPEGSVDKEKEINNTEKPNTSQQPFLDPLERDGVFMPVGNQQENHEEIRSSGKHSNRMSDGIEEGKQEEADDREAEITDWSEETEKPEFSDTTQKRIKPLTETSNQQKEERNGRIDANAQRRKMSKKKNKTRSEWVEYYESGGFLTFFALRHFAEERTIYLPFIPKKVSPVIWGGMRFIVVLGDEGAYDNSGGSSPMAVAIRVDASNFTEVPCGEAPLYDVHSESKGGRVPAESHFDHGTLTPNERGDLFSEKKEENQMCLVRRFQPIPIVLPIGSDMLSTTAFAAPIAISSISVAPPSITVLYSTLSGDSKNDAAEDAVVALYTLTGMEFVTNTTSLPRSVGRYRQLCNHSGQISSNSGAILTVQIAHQAGHLARIPCTIESRKNIPNIWCHGGQGWSLIGIERHVHFVCWEGATKDQGAFVREIDPGQNSNTESTAPLNYSRMLCNILPMHSISPNEYTPRHQEIIQDKLDTKASTKPSLSFTSSYRTPSGSWMQGNQNITMLLPLSLDNDCSTDSTSDINNTVAEALNSISNLSYREIGPRLTQTIPRVGKYQPLNLSKQEKSRRLLRHCSSWTQLEPTQASISMFDGQVPISLIRLGTKPEDQFILSLRRELFENGTATPFSQVLSWLCHHNEYFCAASVALDLLGDIDSLRELRRSAENAESIEKWANLEGLLDGIVPLDIGRNDSELNISRKAVSTLTKLADMTVGCLVKGGLPMSNTLEVFLGRNTEYDPARACLVLAAAATCLVSGDNTFLNVVMGPNSKEKATTQQSTTELLWPVRCLLRVAVARDFLPTAMLLLNEAIPDELRMRRRFGERVSNPPSSLQLCTSIVTMIVASSPDAAERLLDLLDEESRTRYWVSLQHGTQLELALINIMDKFPLLREIEVRAWILKNLQQHIESAAEPSSDLKISEATLPTPWLKQLCDACTRNAKCSLEELFTDLNIMEDDTDGIHKHLEELRISQNALASSPGSGGLDFDLLIPALLLLESRGGILWRDNMSVSTQTVLDAASYLAGRHGAEEPAFAFDASTVMTQCALSNNVSAGSNLIGGRDGLVLKCCDILIKGCGIGMDDAETFLLQEKFVLPNSIDRGDKAKSFAITDGHRHVLWILDEHVLSVKTFGEFETVHIRGRVDPVFASRECFRTWLCLNANASATSWLVSWLRRRLGMDGIAISKKRLACAAITRALLWPDYESVSGKSFDNTESSDQVMANVLGIDSNFLVQLSQSSCGLVEAIPPSLVEELLREEKSSPDILFGSAPLRVGINNTEGK